MHDRVIYFVLATRHIKDLSDDDDDDGPIITHENMESSFQSGKNMIL